MPVSAPLQPGISGAEQAARSLASSAPASGGIIAEVESFLGLAGESAGVAAAAGADSGAVTAAAVAGEAAASTGLLPIIVGILLVLLLLRFIEGIFVWMAGKIPLIGGGAANVVRGSFRWLDNLENGVLGWLGAQIQHLLHAFVQLVGWCVTELGFFIPSTQPAPRAQPGQVATEQEVHNLQAQINQLRKELSSIEYTLTPSGPVTGPPLPAPGPTTNVTEVTRVVTVGVPQKVWDEIHALQDTQAKFQTDLNHIAAQVNQAVATSARTAQEQVQLSQSIHAIRAVATGWQEVENQLQNLGGLVTQFIDETATELSRQDAVQKQMAPLGLLLAPGLPGLKTLRQLEDTPCMCPKLPNIPRLHPELLAMYEFVTNG